MTSTQTLRETATAIINDKRPNRNHVVALAVAWLGQNPEKLPLPKTLTSRQREIFDYIHETLITRQTAPTMREIGYQFGIRSPNGVMCHVRALVRKGLLLHTPHSSRGLRIADSYR